MGRVQIIRHPVDSELYFILEPDGTKTIVRNGYAGMVIEQRRPDGSKGKYTTYEEYGMHVYPHLLRLLVAVHQPLPHIPNPKKEGNDDFAKAAEMNAEYGITISYPYSESDPGFGGNKRNTIRAIRHPTSGAPGLLISQSSTRSVFLSPDAARAVLMVLPRIYPRYSSYRIMERTVRRAAKEGRVQKIEFETGVGTFQRTPSRPPLRARKGFGKIIKRWVRIQKRRQ